MEFSPQDSVGIQCQLLLSKERESCQRSENTVMRPEQLGSIAAVAPIAAGAPSHGPRRGGAPARGELLPAHRPLEGSFSPHTAR